jgi:prepilin-type N-terminal cleavage/methylation domain-containing protein
MNTGMKPRPGVSLVEVLVALTLMTVVLTALSGLTFRAARQTNQLSGGGYRQGVLVQETNRLTAEPFANLPALAGCVTEAGGVFPHTRCVTVTNLSSTRRRATIIVTPAQPGVRPDTVIVERTNPPVGNPLSTL